MQRLASAFGDNRVFRFFASPGTRRALRAGRTVGLAGTLAYAGYGTGVHDALNDPEGTTAKILEHVLVASGGGKLLPLSKTKLAFVGPHADATQAMLSNYHGDNELVNDHSPLAAAQKRWLTQPVEVSPKAERLQPKAEEVK